MIRSLAALALLALTALPALADDVSTSDVYACKSITTDAERLACYDAAVGRLKAAEEAGEVKTVTRKEVEQVKRESFGFSIPSLPNFAFGKKDDGGEAATEDLKELTEAVASVGGTRGALRVTLANGQVWVQIDDKKVAPKHQSEARIYEAALGSYKMKLDGGLAFRVRRER